jgi:CBS domain-containing protein
VCREAWSATLAVDRALIVPIVADGRVQAILTRRDFFRAVADRFTGLA